MLGSWVRAPGGSLKKMPNGFKTQSSRSKTLSFTPAFFFPLIKTVFVVWMQIIQVKHALSQKSHFFCDKINRGHANFFWIKRKTTLVKNSGIKLIKLKSY